MIIDKLRVFQTQWLWIYFIRKWPNILICLSTHSLESAEETFLGEGVNSQGNKRKTPSVCQGDGVIRQDSNLVAAKLEYEDEAYKLIFVTLT